MTARWWTPIERHASPHCGHLQPPPRWRSCGKYRHTERWQHSMHGIGEASSIKRNSWWRSRGHRRPARIRTILELEPLEMRVLPTLVIIGASKDNTIYQESGSLSNGLGPSFYAGNTGGTGGTTIRRAMIAFDISGNVPAGATIN